MASELFLILLIAYACFTDVFSCSCPPESWGKPREQGIRDDFEYSANVYTAIVSSADCKCFPATEEAGTCPTTLDCVNYAINDSNAFVESVRRRYECLERFPCPLTSYYGFPECEHVREELAASSSVDITTDQDIPFTNVTGEPNCGIAGYDGEGCQLSHQPCLYNVTIVTIYKGTLASGEILTTPGPDVLTTCGAIGRLLTLGVEYVVGIGGPCSPMQQWSTLASFSDTEVDLLKTLQQCAENPSSCDEDVGTDPTVDTVMTTPSTDPVTMATDNTNPTKKDDNFSSGAAPVFHITMSFLFALTHSILPFFFH